MMLGTADLKSRMSEPRRLSRVGFTGMSESITSRGKQLTTNTSRGDSSPQTRAEVSNSSQTQAEGTVHQKHEPRWQLTTNTSREGGAKFSKLTSRGGSLPQTRVEREAQS